MRALSGHAGWVAALLMSFLLVWWQHERQFDPRIPNDRFHLPAFDAFVYVAMSDNPPVFTVAPWGYRALTPWLVNALEGPRIERGFRRLTIAGLALSGALLFAWLRRLGHHPLGALAATLLFGLSGPVADIVDYRYLADPVSLLLLLAVLLALESGAGIGSLALLTALGALNKEIAFLALPAVFVGLWERARRETGARPALRAASLGTLGVALPAALVTFWLRAYWAPHLTADATTPGLAQAPEALAELMRQAGTWGPPLLMAGVLPLGVVGLLRREARPFLVRYGSLAAASLLLPFGAGFYAASGGGVRFFSEDVPRLLLYALPFWLALALGALRPAEPRPCLSRAGGLSRVAGVAAALLAVALPLRLDRYRRIDLGASRDGPLLLALCGESVRAASRLARGQEVRFDAERHRFAPGHADPLAFTRMRWFLRDGWGEVAHYGMHQIRMRASSATLLLPLLAPSATEIRLELEAQRALRLRVFAGGQTLASIDVPVGASSHAVRIPAEALVRGDNELTLVSRGSPERLILHALAYRPAP